MNKRDNPFLRKLKRDNAQNEFINEYFGTWRSPSKEEIQKTENAFNAMLQYEFEQKKFKDIKIERRDFPMRERFTNRRPDMAGIAASFRTTIKEMKAQRNLVEKHMKEKL